MVNVEVVVVVVVKLGLEALICRRNLVGKEVEGYSSHFSFLFFFLLSPGEVNRAGKKIGPGINGGGWDNALYCLHWVLLFLYGFLQGDPGWRPRENRSRVAFLSWDG